MAELEERVYQRVLELSEEGKALEAANDLAAAKGKFLEALSRCQQITFTT
jgi:hypothetical protein